ncbi:rhodanese-like domain-containing protein [Pseudonocardia abyssalis]|uniref:Rhodanese domain-containing protein n=1 Tax=Pseudonocardia abyssalis TaxID=2792008 RepID=A0ABS6UPK2_9PSEU|nr:hypothetical protein [Pseudonocardia abyssalis]MBW0119432.1 hypothetical protein [Pseudonocardia abyssalis]MBW0133828.1 hypothetical protein [Pseudonocardia abyssalis]
MFFTQHYLECLSRASYVIGDEATVQARHIPSAELSRRSAEIPPGRPVVYCAGGYPSATRLLRCEGWTDVDLVGGHDARVAQPYAERTTDDRERTHR